MNKIRFASLTMAALTLTARAFEEDFESGRYDQWSVEGAAFGKGPVEIVGLDGSLPGMPWSKFYCPGRQGRFVAHSAPEANLAAQGKLTSKPFGIDKKAIRFLIGGGSGQATRMDLLIDGRPVRSASGEGVMGVTQRVWDVSEFKGKQGVLQIVDAAADGYIVVDGILTSDSLDLAPRAEDPRDFLTLRPVEQKNTPPWPDGWVKDPNAKLLFMGDSITAGWDVNAFHKSSPNRNFVNLGRSMEQVAHLLWRLDHINCDGAQAKLIVLMIGSNDGACNFSAQDVAAGVAAVVAKLRAKMPQAKVLVMSILPRGDHAKDEQQAYTRINPLLAKLADGSNVFYLDIFGKYLGRYDMIDRTLMNDLVHPTAKGYELWAEAMEPVLKKLLD